MSEVDLEMNQVHEEIKREVVEVSQVELPMLEYHMRLLPAPADEGAPLPAPVERDGGSTERPRPEN